jgi:aspartate aminotransferase, mitochondrial
MIARVTPRVLIRGIRQRSTAVAASAWKGTEAVPADPILGLVAAFKADSAPRKVNLAQGAYRTDDGAPYVLASVQEAERRTAEALARGDIDKEYLPIEGDATFRALSAQLVFGTDSPSLKEGRCATLQTISGTGAVSVAAAALRQIAGVSESDIHPQHSIPR